MGGANAKAIKLNTEFIEHCQESNLDGVINLLSRKAYHGWNTASFETPLVIAAKNGSVSIFKVLLESKADINYRTNYLNPIYGGVTALMKAAECGHTDIIDFALNSSPKNNKLLESASNCGNTLLFYASGNGCAETVQFLIERRANIEHKNKEGDTPLLVSAKNGHLKTVMLLLDYGASPTATNKDEMDCLKIATFFGHTDIAHTFASRFPASLSLVNKSVGNALSYAAKSSSLPMAQMLVEFRSDVNAVAKDGTTVLMWAALSGNSEVLNLLLDHGAPLEAKDKFGYRAMTYGVQRGHTDVVLCLLSRGARTDFNCHLDEGTGSLLELANENHHPQIVKILQDHA